MLALRKQQQRRFDHNHCAIHQDPEIQGTETHQVPTDAEALHSDHGKQERERDHQGSNGRGANVAEQQKQHDDDQQGTNREILRNRANRGIDQLTAVENDFNFDSRGQ